MARHQSKPEILVVEDQDDIRDIVSELLIRHGFRTLSAANGKEALELLESTRPAPSVILLDLDMPIMTGEQLLLALDHKGLLRTIKVVICSATPQYIPAAALAKAHMRLDKPFTFQKLMKVISALSGHKGRGSSN
jgi:CheY-like chemotaxis protein